VKQTSPHVLLINPWITDFAAYNFWVKPLGILSIAGFLRKNGFQVSLIDCLDFYSKRKQYGDGNFFKTWIEKPKPLKSIPKQYSRYGISEELLQDRLSSMEKPDVVGITSGMTYWYPGLFELIRIIKKSFKEVPIILGGIYATLCHDHAQKNSGADHIVQGIGELEALRLISELTHTEPPWSTPGPSDNCDQRPAVRSDPYYYPEHRAIGIPPPTLQFPADYLSYPSFDLYPELDYICVATSRGCPLRCTYCASKILYNGFRRRNPDEVVEEIEYWTTHDKVKNIAFYDDALLINHQDHAVPILKEVIKRKIRCNFHTPNGLHVKEIDEELADLLFKAGFKTIRLGLETAHEAMQIETGGKVGNQDFVMAIKNLKRAGYCGEEIGVYIMVGLPGQRAGEAEESIAFVLEAEARPILVEYSPIPHTPLFERAKQVSQFDLENEPLYQNNSILPCQWEEFTMADYRRLKEGIRR
jgi:radical SAM superfamily enzyme YgiQ (UPF0313 family)